MRRSHRSGALRLPDPGAARKQRRGLSVQELTTSSPLRARLRLHQSRTEWRVAMALHRRQVLKQSFILAGAAGLLGSSVGRGVAQTLGAMRRANRYDDTYIFERKRFTWPGGKTMAVWIAPNVEVWHYDSPVGQAVTPNVTNRV